MPEKAGPRIEFLILADRAEVVGGKLYLMGGGWDQVTLPPIDPSAVMAIGVAVRVTLPPGDHASHTVTLSIEGPGDPTIIPNRFQFVPSENAPADRRLNVLIATECLLGVKEVGAHAVVARLDSGEPTHAWFTVEKTVVA
jgi:hypothetical protein